MSLCIGEDVNLTSAIKSSIILLTVPMVFLLRDPDLRDVPEHFQSISESISIRNSNEPLGERNCRRGQNY